MDFENDEEIEKYLMEVYTGVITTYSLNFDYHRTVSSTLDEAVLKGWGQGLESEILQGLRSNIYVFSGAKQYQQVRSMQRVLLVMSRKANALVPFSDFKKEALQIFEDYNINYLRTEYNTAVTQSQNARKWAKIVEEKELFPKLVYRTQRDGLVRHEHAALDGVTLPVGHSFWKTNYPANGWNCRCFVQQVDEGVDTKNIPSLSDKDQPELFKMNAGRDKYVFDPKRHPYFRVARGDKQLRENNYNLPRV